MSGLASNPPGPPRGRPPVPHPVWALNLALIALVSLLTAGPVGALAPLARPHLPWWALALGFAAAERWVVHLHLRGGAQSFSLGEVPLVFGLIFSSGAQVVLASALGALLVLSLDRRLPAIKLVFNAAQLALSPCVAVLVAHAVAQPASHVELGTWVAAVLGAQAAGLATVPLIAAAMALSGERPPARTLARMLTMDAVVTLSNSSLAICGVMMTVADPRTLPLLAVPFATLYFAYRAYLSERQRDQQLDFVHEANRTLAGSQEVAQALETLLARSLETFRAQAAEIVLFGSDQDPPLRTLLGPGPARALMVPLEPAVAAQMRTALRGGAAPLQPGGGGVQLARYLHARGITDAIIAPLPGEERPLGAILLANRRGVERHFDHHDLKLLETLAANASAALRYDRLGHAVRQLRVAQEQLQHEAHHDPLTGVVTRAEFIRRVREALAARRQEVGVLFLDLDNFKAVNDTLGHAAGDELLVTVARRLQRCLRGDDTVGRLGGDEFAVLICGGENPNAAAVSVAQRIVGACAIQVGAGEAAIQVRASVGISVATPDAISAERLLAEADAAMYQAKRAGKGRFHVFDRSLDRAGPGAQPDPGSPTPSRDRSGRAPARPQSKEVLSV